MENLCDKISDILGGDIGVMEVVRFLEKNSERYSIDKKLVYSKTVDAFQARVSVTKFEL